MQLLWQSRLSNRFLSHPLTQYNNTIIYENVTYFLQQDRGGGGIEYDLYLTFSYHTTVG